MRLAPRLIVLCLLVFAAPVQAASLMVVSNGWHTGLVIDRQDIPPNLLPEIADFDPAAKWFEIGWGSALYYPARKPGWGLALKAALPGSAVIHIAGLTEPYDAVFPRSRSIRLCLEPDEMRKLIGRIDTSIERNGQDRATSNYPGLYPFSAFYPAKGSFHLLHTCNSWTAEILGPKFAPFALPIARSLTVQLSNCPE